MLVKLVAVKDVVELESAAVRTFIEGAELVSKAKVESIDVKADMVVLTVVRPGGARVRYGIPLGNVRHVEYHPAKGGA